MWTLGIIIGKNCQNQQQTLALTGDNSTKNEENLKNQKSHPTIRTTML